MTNTSSHPPAPQIGATHIDLANRIEALDVLRGVAVLGILVVNIQLFAMVDPAYRNPSVFGDLTGLNYVVWQLTHLFFDMKFITIFSLLYGAGIYLMCSRNEQSGGSPAGAHYRRSLWLLLFGLAHAYLLWRGDILVWYAVSAMIAYPLWRLRPGWLLFWGVLLLAVGTAIYGFFQWSIPYWPEESVRENMAYWQPPAELVAERLEAYRGSWMDQMSHRVPDSLFMQTFVYLIFGFWRIVGCMLLGMALMKWGVFSAALSKRFYVAIASIGLPIGIAISWLGMRQNIAHGFSWDFSMFAGELYNYWSSLPQALAYASIIALLCKADLLRRLRRWLAATGRMAFSCYILQTLICTIVFYGHGFGLVGYLPRWGQLVATLLVWGVVLMAANLWLSRYRFGPLEWLWRSLTYRRRLPNKLIAT